MWLIPPPTLKLATDEVHVWRAAVDQTTAIQSFNSFLSDDERLKAERFHFQKDRARFIICRGILKQILSCYLGCKAQDLKFCYNEFGKLALCATDVKQPICFNLSHSHNLALIAVTQNRVGDAQEPYRWLLQELSPDPNYVAALAVAGNNWQVKYRQWCDDFSITSNKI